MSVQLKNQEIESLQALELDDSSSLANGNAADMKIKLLHHLVEFSRVFQQKPNEAEVEQLIKKNNNLVNELLDWSAEPATDGEAAAAMPVKGVPVKGAPIVWQDLLMQKLIDEKVNLADQKVKEFANRAISATSKKIDDLLAGLVRQTTSFARAEEKITYEFEPYSSKAGQLPAKAIYLRSLTFNVTLLKNPIDFTVYCSDIPADKSCKVKVDVKVKNQAGFSDWNRSFSKVFTKALPQLNLLDLIRKEEYDDETLGHVKNGKMCIEVVIRADEPVKLSQTTATNQLPGALPAAGAMAPVLRYPLLGGAYGAYDPLFYNTNYQ